ncbi:MAG: hypothetical protein AAFR27_03660 [Pseudomonadota bacterium]
MTIFHVRKAPMTPKHSQTVKLRKAVAHFSVDTSVCPYRKCREAKTCTGGPRGTFRRFGKPYCQVKEVALHILRAVNAKKVRQAFLKEEAREREALDAYISPFRSK